LNNIDEMIQLCRISFRMQIFLEIPFLVFTTAYWRLRCGIKDHWV